MRVRGFLVCCAVLVALLGYAVYQFRLPVDADWHGGATDQQRLLIRLIDTIGGLFMHPSDFYSGIDRLYAHAINQTGLTDFGWDADPGAKEGFEILYECFRDTGRPSIVGGFIGYNTLLRCLERRLRYVDALKRHREYVEQTQIAPLFVVGMFRSGTSFLLNTLARDPQFRFLRHYELSFPLPSREQELGLEPDTRHVDLQNEIDFITTMNPWFSAVHLLTNDGPEECVYFFFTSFRSLSGEMQFKCPVYTEWIQKQDHHIAYETYANQLKIMQHLDNDVIPRQWIVKSPVHLEHLSTLLDTFPDAKIVWLHRDPAISTASLTSLTAHLRALYSNHVDINEVSAFSLDMIERLLKNGMEGREHASSGQIFDLSYGSLLADPIRVIEDVYAHFGFELRDEVREDMIQHLSQNPQHQHGAHRYMHLVPHEDELRSRPGIARYYEELRTLIL
mmetsp:Transcript_17506/g.44607  ORF Transcript_17506/g.44607 Transcript_17506/m.44607 type:complete len:449 (-) Transcript_17506:23-1369(-)